MLNLHGKLQRATFYSPFYKSNQDPMYQHEFKKWLDLTRLSVCNVLCSWVCCGEQSEVSGRSGYASPRSLRPLSGAEARLLELLFAAERSNSSACAQTFSVRVCCQGKESKMKGRSFGVFWVLGFGMLCGSGDEFLFPREGKGRKEGGNNNADGRIDWRDCIREKHCIKTASSSRNPCHRCW